MSWFFLVMSQDSKTIFCALGNGFQHKIIYYWPPFVGPSLLNPLQSKACNKKQQLNLTCKHNKLHALKLLKIYVIHQSKPCN